MTTSQELPRFIYLLKYIVTCFLIVLFIIFQSGRLKDTNSNYKILLKIPQKTIKRDVTFWLTGDAMMHLTQYKAAINPRNNVPEFDSCYSYIRSIVKKADIRIINLETTLAGPQYSGYPRFCAPKELCRCDCPGRF